MGVDDCARVHNVTSERVGVMGLVLVLGRASGMFVLGDVPDSDVMSVVTLEVVAVNGAVDDIVSGCDCVLRCVTGSSTFRFL